MNDFFSFEGRTDRISYFGFYVFWIMICVALGAVHVLVLPIVSLPIVLIVFGLMVVSSVAISVRRLHDMGISGWALIFLVLVSGVVTAMGAIATYYPQELSDYFTANPSMAQTYLWTAIALSTFTQLANGMLIFWPGDEDTNRFG